jgi:hypothetical protein
MNNYTKQHELIPIACSSESKFSWARLLSPSATEAAGLSLTSGIATVLVVAAVQIDACPIDEDSVTANRVAVGSCLCRRKKRHCHHGQHNKAEDPLAVHFAWRLLNYISYTIVGNTLKDYVRSGVIIRERANWSLGYHTASGFLHFATVNSSSKYE